MSFSACFRFFGVLLLLALAGCGKRDEEASSGSEKPLIAPNQAPEQGDWVVQDIPADPDTLNPITGQDETGNTIHGNIFESLLTTDNFTLKLKPQLAESYEISPDQMVYTFHLHHDAKWSDGVPFTSADVIYSYNKIQDPKVDCAPIRNYFANVKSCVAPDDYTVVFTTTEKFFKTLESIGEMPIVPKHILEKGEPDFNKHPFGRAPIGTGPYKFVRWDTGSQIVLERDDHYWGGGAHYPQRLVYRVLSEPYVAAQLLKKGELDVVDGMAPVQWERELAHSRSVSRIQKFVYDYPAYSYIGFNLRLPLFADVRVRHAIDLLIPRDEIQKKIYLGEYANQCSGYDPPSSPNYNHSVPPTPYDPTLALQLLNQAGWKNDHGDGLLYKDGKPLSFSLLYRSGSDPNQKMVELVQESLRRAGIDLKLVSMEVVVMYDRAEDWKFDAILGGWALDLNGDPYQLWHSSQAKEKKSSNFIGFANPAADKLIAAGRLEYDDDKRAAIYRQLHQLIHDDYPVCFLFNPKVILLVSNRFQNVKIFAPRPCFDITSWWVPKPWQKYGD